MIKSVKEILNNFPNIDTAICRPDDINQVIHYFDELSNVCVPQSGKADTIGGECIRAMQKVLYRAVNDGDMIGNLQNFGYVESAIGYIYGILENYYSIGMAKQFYFAEVSFLDVIEDIKRAKRSSNVKEFFNKHHKVTMNDYINQVKSTAIDLMLIFKEDDFIFNMINKNDDYLLTPLEDFIHAMRENYSIEQDEMINAWNKYLAFKEFLRKKE